MTDIVRYLTEQDIVSLVSMDDAINALRSMLTLRAHDAAACNAPKSLATWGDGASMHALGSVMPGGGYAGFKTWVRTNKGGGSLFTLFDANAGTLLAIIEARALGLLRTAAMTGVATDVLSRTNISTGALIGSGPQAEMQLRAISAVRPLQECRVFSPTRENREAFCERLQSKFAAKLIACETAQQALDGAEIATTITRSVEPFITADMLQECELFNAVGAILPTKAEFSDDVFDLAGKIVVDDRENAVRGSKEFRDRFGETLGGWETVHSLESFFGNSPAMPKKMTLFKAMGMGLSDLAVAVKALEAAEQRSVGKELPKQVRENLLAKA